MAAGLIWVDVAAPTDVPPGTAITVQANGWAIALSNVDGRWFAIENTCPHMGGPLGRGELQGEVLLCPWHAWRFDVRTGCAVANPQVQVLRFNVKIADGRCWVEVPA
ncbi:MAG: Rieske (2Fe-2S) protein [Planctomycetota bacterium]